MYSVLTSTMSDKAKYTSKETKPQQTQSEKLSKKQTNSAETTMNVDMFNSSMNGKSAAPFNKRPDLLPSRDEECNQSSCSSDEAPRSVYNIDTSEDETTHSYNDEDDDNRYMDNEDMDKAELTNRRRRTISEDEANDDYEEHSLRSHVHNSDDTEDTDTEYERDITDRASDDFILTKRLKRNHREKSFSLQNLSDHRYRRKYLDFQPNLAACSSSAMHRRISLKYQNMKNKGIRMNEERTKQLEHKNMENHESTINQNHERIEDNDVDHSNASIETIKNNPESANEPQTGETQTANLIHNTVQIAEHFKTNQLSDRIIENGYVNTEDIQYSHVQNEKYMENSDDKLEDVHDPIDVNVQMECNGTEMVEPQDVDNSDTSCCLKIINVKSIRMTRDESENFNSPKNVAVDRLNAEVTELKTQLHQFRQFHQTALAENMKMQQEIDGLKKSLSKYEETQTCEPKDAIENGMIIETTPKQDVVASGQLNNQNENIMETSEINKMSMSNMEPGTSYTNETIEAVHDTVKSTESTNSPSFLNTEDNIATSMTSKKLETMSPAFATSARILKTLSNIMLNKDASPLPENTKKRLIENLIQNQNKKSDSPIITSSKKRKAEVLNIPSHAPHLKIPNLNIESENEDINKTNVKYEYPVEYTSTISKQEDDKILIDKTIDDSSCMETKMYFANKNTNNVGNGSFLIQTEEPAKDLVNEKNRECGPFVLGNLEVMMSEANGKINIWGKEINVSDSDDENEDDFKTLEELVRLQDKFQSRFDRSPFVCSTNKKKKMSLRLNKSNIPQCCNLHLNSINGSSLENVSDEGYAHSSRRMSCKNCSSSKCDTSLPRCNYTSSLPETIHSCCKHHMDTMNKACNCESCRKIWSFDVSCKCRRHKFHNVGIQQDLCTNAHVSNSKSSSDCINYQMASTSSQNCYKVPLKTRTKSAEAKKEKLSGEKVRSILMDFLRTHEGDRDISATDSNEIKFQQKEPSHRLNDSQQIKSSTPTEKCDRYCYTYESRMAAQLGKLETSVETLQSRLDAIFDVLNKPRPMDIN